ncbi:YopX family protein [Enterococcus gilvus]|uniref:YopX family protein n=1 Tax=Enterococcus gilvus TaxID=160453 RepID=UPI003D6AF951
MIPKFRAWDKETAEMCNVGALYFSRDYELEVVSVHLPSGYVVNRSLTQVILMQSTGLKDKNGVEIFEGDVVVGQQYLTTDSSTPFEIKGLVRYSKRNTMFYLDEKSFGHDKFMNSLGSSVYQFEVIGNSFANPELLEVE